MNDTSIKCVLVLKWCLVETEKRVQAYELITIQMLFKLAIS